MIDLLAKHMVSEVYKAWERRAAGKGLDALPLPAKSLFKNPSLKPKFKNVVASGLKAIAQDRGTIADDEKRWLQELLLANDAELLASLWFRYLEGKPVDNTWIEEEINSLWTRSTSFKIEPDRIDNISRDFLTGIIAGLREYEPQIAAVIGIDDVRERVLDNQSMLKTLLERVQRPNQIGNSGFGKLNGVPDLPAFHLERTEILSRLMTLVKGTETAAITAQRAVGAYGMGGIGKTTLAAALAHDEDIWERFPDGVFWVTLGQDGNPFQAQQTIFRMATGENPVFETTAEGKNRLRQALEGKAALLIVDDVWELNHIEPLRVVSGNSRLLLTTRILKIVNRIGADALALETLDENQALALLRSTSRREKSLPAVASDLAKACGYLPLALASIGTQLRGKPAKAWKKILRRLEAANINRFRSDLPGYPYDNLFKVFQVSFETFDKAVQARYLDLAVFPEDTPVPTSVLNLWWGHEGADEFEIDDWIEAFCDCSMARLVDEGEALALHDLQCDFLVAQLDEEALRARHGRLADAFGAACPKDCFVLPLDHTYYYQHIAWHLHEAGLQTRLEDMLLDFDWMRARMEATDLFGLTHDYRFAATDTHKKIRQCLTLSSHVLLRDPNQLAAQCLARLDRKTSMLQRFLETSATRAIGFRPRNLSLKPPGGAAIRTLSGHSGGINAAAILPDGQRALSASDDRTLKLWDLASGQALVTLSGHSNRVRAVAVSPDGQRALSASEEGTLMLWDLATGQELATLFGHTRQVTEVAILPDGQRALSASADWTLMLWDLATGQELATLSGHSGPVYAAAILPDGQRALSASSDKTLKLWDLASGQALTTLSGHSKAVNAAAITPDGQRVLSASNDRTLMLWDLTSGDALATLSGHSDGVTAVAVLPDGQRALSAAGTTLKLWDLNSGQELATLSGHSGWVTAVAVLPDGQRALSAVGTTLKLWDLASGQALATLSGHSAVVRAVTVIHDGQRTLSVSKDGTLKLWDLASGQALATLSGHSGEVRAVAITPDGQHALSASDDGTLKLWDLASGQALATLYGHSKDVDTVAILPDGRRALSASLDGTLKLWDLASKQMLATLSGHTSWVTAAAILPDGQRALSASDDGTLKLWDLASGQEMTTLYGHSKAVNAVAITPDGQRALSAAGTTLRLWDLASKQMLATLSGHSDWVRAVTALPDGQRAISASDDGTLKLWDLASGEVLATLSGHSRGVLAAAILPGGHRALSASVDWTLKLWDLASGQALATLFGHSRAVLAAAILPDGQRALSASEDKTLKLWDLTSGEALATFTGEAPMLAIQVTLDGKIAIAGDSMGRIHILDIID